VIKKQQVFLYPFIEILTAIALSLVYLYIPLHYFFGYFIFCSALIVTIRSDIETMLILRDATISLVPVGMGLSIYGFLPLSIQESLCGALFGYLFLRIISSIFKYWRNLDGIGEGDFDLLVFIGSFTGIIGCWISITIGSIVGSLYGITTILFSQKNISFHHTIQNTKIPFGPFLAIGALIFIFIQKHVFHYLLIR